MDPIQQGWLKKKNEFYKHHKDNLLSEGYEWSGGGRCRRVMIHLCLRRRLLQHRHRSSVPCAFAEVPRGNETRGREWSGTSLDLIHPKQSRNTRLTKPHSLKVLWWIHASSSACRGASSCSSTQVDSSGNTKRTGGQAPKEAVDMWRNNQHPLGKS